MRALATTATPLGTGPEIGPDREFGQHDPGHHGGNAEPADLSPLQVALRYRWLILVFALAIAALTYVGLTFVTPTYVSSASVALDGRHMNVVGSDSALFSAQPLDPDIMKTEMEVLGSQLLALKVVDQLGLADRIAFERCVPHGISAKLRAAILGPQAGDCTPDPDLAASALLSNVVVFSNDHASYVVKITATTSDPVLAAGIANAYARVYVDWRRDSRTRQADEAGRWLSTYLASLHARMEAANEAVETYRQNNHLIDLSPGLTGGQAATVVSQSLSQLNTQLVQTDADLAEHQAQLSQAQSAGGSSATTLASPVVQDLLERRAEAAASLAQRRARYGDEHPLVLSAQAELSLIDEQLRTESGRTVASLAGTVRALNSRRAALSSQVDRLQKGVAGESQADVRLAELSREADTENALYRTMLERLKDVDAERHIQLPDSQLVVPATVPSRPNFPRKGMMVTGVFLASLGIGVGLAFLREMTNPRFRDLRQIEAETGIGVLGAFAAPPRGTTPRDFVLRASSGIETELLHTVLARLTAPRAGMRQTGRVIAVTSALPAEGKSSFAVSLGRLAAKSGFRTLLLDADLRRSSLGSLMDTATAPAQASSDAGAIATRHVPLPSEDAASGLKLLSLSVLVEDPRHILAARHLDDAFEEMRDMYDIVIIDTPPVLAVPDTGHIVPLADEVVVVVDWKNTPRDAVQGTVRELFRVGGRIAGLVVSKLDPREYGRIGNGPVHDIGRYSAYFAKNAA